jgi:hypothetical protein
LLIAMTDCCLSAPTYVNGLVPDWSQPYDYANPNGPGPDPSPNTPNQWNDWCVPTSAANLAGYWTDYRGVPVADTTAYPGSTVAWGAGPSWQDYLADSNRPAAQVAASSFPSPVTDIGWYLDTNRGVKYDDGSGNAMGGWFFGDGNHNGTLLKNIHVGLQNFLSCRYGLSGSTLWKAGTQGIGYAGGVNSSGQPAQMHANEASTFAEVEAEINTNRPLILSFSHWNLVPTGQSIASTGTSTESQYGGTYYTWGDSPGPTNVNGEEWNFYNNDQTLGHSVTCVGYIPANDPDDLFKGTTNATDWVIVHDTWPTTARNVIIPLNFAQGAGGTWVANTTVVPWPTATKFVKGLVPDWNQPYRYTGLSPFGGPGPDPGMPGQLNQWNDWCAPASAANLAGYWADYHLTPVADTMAYPNSTVMWGAGPSWQDYLADGFARPAPETNPPASLPPSPTDIGWYMDTNLGVPYDLAGAGTMGGYYFGNPPHSGTYLKDIHVGLQNYLNSLYRSGPGWDTGAAGKVFAGGLDSTGGVAQVLTDELSAFSQVRYEIDHNHVLLLCYKHWNVAAAQTSALTAVGQSTEADYGGTYYVWGDTPPPLGNAEDEQWSPGDDSSMSLGHVVTAVGYIPAGDPLDPGPSLGAQGLGIQTDWVIVHDNWVATPRNVIIPYDWPGNWTANIIAYPDLGFLQVTGISLAGGTNVEISFTGLPGGLHQLQWESDLLSNSWTTVVSNMTFSAGTMRMTNAVPSSQQRGFYRIEATY